MHLLDVFDPSAHDRLDGGGGGLLVTEGQESHPLMLRLRAALCS